MPGCECASWDGCVLFGMPLQVFGHRCLDWLVSVICKAGGAVASSAHALDHRQHAFGCGPSACAGCYLHLQGIDRRAGGAGVAMQA